MRPVGLIGNLDWISGDGSFWVKLEKVLFLSEVARLMESPFSSELSSESVMS